MADMHALYDAILDGSSKLAASVTEEALGGGADPEALLALYMIPAMDEVGRRFEAQDYFVPELLLAARAMKSALELLRPRLADKGTKPVGRVVIGTVKGDLHDIGKNLVAAMLEGGGFEVVDLGADVAPERFVDEVKARKADLVCLSALLTVTMLSMRTTIEALKRAGIRDGVKVLVGGAPVTREFADEIGADGYSDNASAAVTVARNLIGMPRS